MPKAATRVQNRPLKVKPVFTPQKIVVPFDFSDLSQAALSKAAGIASQYGAVVLIVHVVEPIIYPVDYLVVPKEMEEGNLLLMENARERLKQVQSELVNQGVQAQTEVRMGRPYLEICDLAKKKKADLIVAGTHGHTGLKHLYLGSTAEKLVRHAPCSVLVVR